MFGKFKFFSTEIKSSRSSFIGGLFVRPSNAIWSGGGGVLEASFLGSGSGSLYFLTLGVEIAMSFPRFDVVSNDPLLFTVLCSGKSFYYFSCLFLLLLAFRWFEDITAYEPDFLRNIDFLGIAVIFGVSATTITAS